MNPSSVKNRSAAGGGRPANVRATSIASILRPSSEDNDGDGPYIDLEFSIPEEDGDSASASASGSDENELSGEKLRPDYPSDDLFFRGHSSLLFTPSSKPLLPSSILKPAARFRVFMLRFKKSKSLHLDSPQSSPNHNKKFPVKFKLDEVPIVSLFTKENSSSRSSTRSSKSKLYAEESIQSPAPTSDEKKNPKDVIHRYLNKIKPLYDLASKRNSGKPPFSGDPPKSAHSSGMRIVSRRLRKSRSASASVAAVRSPPRRREESVIVEEDGIQSAIAHCKRSFSSGCDLGVVRSSLVRSRSDPGTERCD